MLSKYIAAFLFPKNAIRILNDDGWNFESETRIPKEIEGFLRKAFILCEADSTFSTYKGDRIKIDLFKDNKSEIEHIYLRFYDGQQPELPLCLKAFDGISELEFFIPSEASEPRTVNLDN